MAELQDRLLSAFAMKFGGPPDLVARAPGRVNLIGEHTDYNDGWVLPMAIGCETRVAARWRGDGRVCAVAADLGRSCAFSVDGRIEADPTEPWSNYLRGLAAALIDQGLPLSGADIAIAGNVPQGAGLSSSASLEVATGLAFAALLDAADYDRTALALAGQRAEHEFAGCQCGIMDQLVSARAEAGSALAIDCRSLSVEMVAMPDDLVVMIVHSGVSRGLVDGEYNSRRAQCEAAARHLGVEALRDADPAMLAERGEGLDPVAMARARHVIGENGRVRDAAGALRAGDLSGLGKLMAASHASLRDLFEVSVPPVDALVDVLQSAIADEGGARMTGGGFGGAVVAVLPAVRVEEVREAVLAGYRTPAGEAPLIMVERPRAGASLVC